MTERECMCTTPEYTIKLNQQGPPGPKGATGSDGFSPIVGVATQTDNVYILNITTSEGVMQTPNLQGRGVPANGSSGQWLIADGNNISHWEDVPNASQLNSGMIKLSTANDIYNLDSDTDWEPNDSNAVTPRDMIDYVDVEIDKEAYIRGAADEALRQEIEMIEASSDVVDIVGTYAELQAYDTSHLQDNDIIKVLSDSTHSNAISYYRWDKDTETWSYIGQEGPYYTQSQVDTLVDGAKVPATNTGILKGSNGKLGLALENTDNYVTIVLNDTSTTSPSNSTINLNTTNVATLISTTVSGLTIDGGTIA